MHVETQDAVFFIKKSRRTPSETKYAPKVAPSQISNIEYNKIYSKLQYAQIPFLIVVQMLNNEYQLSPSGQCSR